MHNFFFSLDFDLTQSQQRIAKLNLNLGERNLAGGAGGGQGPAGANGGDTQAAGKGGGGVNAALWKRADARFFWNADLIGDLIACSADEWVVPFERLRGIAT